MLALALLLAAAPLFDRYQAENETTCIGKADAALEQPEEWSEIGFKFTVKGGRADVHAEGGKASGGKLGLLAAVKDFSPETQRNLEAFVSGFRRAGVSGIVVGGDSAYGVDDQDSTLAELFSWLGNQGLPVYVLIGNSESRSAFNRAALAAFRRHPNVINVDLVRRVDADGFTLVSLPGYYDKRYIQESAGCQYKAEDAQELSRIVRGAASPVVLISHGPPRQEGRGALDVTVDGHNVGDPELASAIAEAKIHFGVFGHILESGGRATDLSGTKNLRVGQLSPTLFLNPGPAFADPWALNGGRTSHGMAAVLSIKDGKGEWQPVLPPNVRAVKYTPRE